jgi:hypothetical protein
MALDGGLVALLGVVLAGIGALAAARYLGRSLVQFRAARRIRASGVSSVTDALASERASLEGVARPHERTLQAPVTGRECLGYTYGNEYRSRGERGDNWYEFAAGRTMVPFVLETEGGSLFVTDDDPALAIHDGEESVVLDPDDARPTPIRQFLGRNRGDPTRGDGIDLTFDREHETETWRFTETVLLPGETTYVAGATRTPTEASRTVPREAAGLVRGPSPDPGPLGALWGGTGRFPFSSPTLPPTSPPSATSGRPWPRLRWPWWR